MEDCNVIEDYGPSNHDCGYCGRPNGFYSHGMIASRLTTETYQDLLDIGWRRSGSYIYKPDLELMCCPTYTIRLRADAFVPDASQRKALGRFERYLNGGALLTEQSTSTVPKRRERLSRQETALEKVFKKIIREVVDGWFVQEGYQLEDALDVVIQQPSMKQRKLLSFDVVLTSPVCLTIFHTLRRRRKNETRWNSAMDVASSFCTFFEQKKSTTGFKDAWGEILTNITIQHTHGYLNVHSNRDKSCIEALAEQLTLSSSDEESTGSESSLLNDAERKRDCNSLDEAFRRAVNRKRVWTTSLVRSSFIEEEFLLYKRYQMHVHGDPEWKCTPRHYSNFLIDTPLVPGSSSSCPDCGFGSFHLQYRIDGHLVAVSVIDILPRCVSSKYFFWDPDFARLSLGKISALKEIEWIREKLQPSCPTLQYYYMGFYIQSCQKMRYKADYAPSELLCPKFYQWVRLTDDMREELSDDQYVALSSVPGAECAPCEIASSVDLDDLDDISDQPVDVSGQRMTFGEYVARTNRKPKRSAKGRRTVQSQIHDNVEILTETITDWALQASYVRRQLIYTCYDVLDN